MTDDVIARQYRDGANLNARVRLHDLYSTNRYGWHEWVFDQLQLRPASRILEIGCGPGYLWTRNARRLPSGWDVTLTDRSPGMLIEAGRNLRDVKHNFQRVAVDAQAIPFPNASFDAVIANHMLYHVPDRSRALAEMRRVLQPGGRLYAATTGQHHLSELEELVRQYVAAPINRERSTTAFTLENGAEQVSQQFSHVDVHRYEDGLLITEIEPLIAYVLSGMAGPEQIGPNLQAFERRLAEILATDGAIRIAKDSGVFVAW